MKQKNKMDRASYNCVSGACFFAFLFLVSSLCVSLIFPDDEDAQIKVNNELVNSKDDSENLENFELVESQGYSLEQGFLVHENQNQSQTAVAKAMRGAVLGHSEKEDEGLKFYRNPEFRDSVVWFYNQITGDEVITDAILINADKNDIPLSLAFALAYSESSYNKNAINKNTNASIDRGLFQLNNNSFPDLVEGEFFDPYVSAKYGLSHLRFCLDTAGNEVAALAMYNAGTRRVKNGETPQVTLNYVSRIVDYRTGVDDLFDFQSENWLDSTLFESIASLR